MHSMSARVSPEPDSMSSSKYAPNNQSTPAVTSSGSRPTSAVNFNHDSVAIGLSATNGEKSRTQSSIRGSTVTFHSLKYSVRAPAPGRRCCCGTENKPILHEVSGIFRPGMNAIMGPTGSGKTTLLDVLAGRVAPGGVEGHILVDGQLPPKNFKCVTGYVVQDDVVMGTLTVRENLMFSANLRISTTMSHSMKCAKVDETIQELGLTAVADSKVGTEFIRGVSGGERKRTNIGMELIISPPVLFLDEPTTGLDASTAFAVLALLKRLSRKGRTIIFSIHQPRFTIFRLFDRLSLLARGHTVYHGLSSKALDYFQFIGYQCEAHNNPPDFFLDVINGDSTAITNTAKDAAVDDDDRAADGIPAPDYDDGIVGVEVVTLAENMANRFATSSWNKELTDELQPILNEFQAGQRNGTTNGVRPDHYYATSFWTQLKYVSKRTVVNLLRNPATFITQIFVGTFIGLIVGVIFLQLDDSTSGLQNRVGALFFISMNQVFQTLAGVELFIKERVIFVHESATGFYRTSAFFFAKIFCDFVPMRLAPLIVFSVITYFMIGLQMDPGNFFIYFLCLFLTTMTASAICFAVSASIKVFAIANLICVLIFIMMMIFAGLLVNVADLPDWLRWLQYLSMVRYSLNTLSINELHYMTFYDTVNGTKVPVITGAEYLTRQGIKHETDWDLWQNQMALGLMTLGFMLLAYIQLRRMKKFK